MKKKKIIALLTSAICLAAAIPASTVFADGQKVLTLGADLDEQQRTAILNYFGVNGQNIQTLTITNQDERDHLGSYVPLEQIGTRTYSCALVCPTNAGGIQVKTANLTWVTSNMIASTLSTSGVVNCDVIAAAPFEVSGTGALTGILMAYESAVGTTLDAEKKEIATQELITTTTIANNIGQVGATEIVNDSKMQVIQGDVVSDNDIDIIINEVAEEQQISLTEEDRELLKDLLTQIAQQDYDYNEMKETLERVEANMDELSAKQEAAQTGETESSDGPVADETETPETAAADSILNQTNDAALGDSVVIDATDPTTISDTPATEATEPSSTIDITTSDSYGDTNPETTADTPAASDTIDILNPEGGTSTDIITDGTSTDVSVDGNDTVVVDGGTDVPADTATPEETVAPITSSEMAFAPITSERTGYAVYAAGQDELTVYINRSNITAGTGMLAVNNAADSSIVETINLNDTVKAAISPMTDEELLDQSWTEGTKAVVYLSNPLAQNSTYFITLSEDAFMTADGTAHSEAVTDPSLWDIQTSEYGFALDKTQNAGLASGTTVTGKVLMDGTAAATAVIENADPAMVTFDVTEFTASGTCNATFYGSGKTTFQVSFYDAEGTPLNTINYTAVVK